MPKRHIAPLVSGRVRLRLLEEADLPMTLAWRNQDHIRKWFLHAEQVSAAQHRAWFSRYLASDDDLVFIIEDIQRDDCPVGQVAIYHIDLATKSAEFGRLMIGDQAAGGRGLAGSATRLLVETAMTEWGLETVTLDVKTDNAAALAIYRACGFRPESQDGSVVRMTRLHRKGLP